MKKIYTYLAMFVAAATMVACENAPEGNVTPDATGKPIEITIGAQDRALLDLTDGKSVTWEAGDQIGLFHKVGDNVVTEDATYTAATAGESTTFTGDATWSGTAEDAHEFYVYYPRRGDANSTDPTYIAKSISTKQYYDAAGSWEKFGTDYSFAYAKASNVTYGGEVEFPALKQFFGIFRLNITNATGEDIVINNVVLTSNEGYLRGTHRIDITKDPATWQILADSKVITCYVENGSVAAGESIDVRFAISPQDYTGKTFTVVVNSDKGAHPAVEFPAGNVGLGGRASKAITIEAVPVIDEIIYKNALYATAYDKNGDKGVIFWVDDVANPTKAKIVSTQSYGPHNWWSDKSLSVVNTGAEDGAANMTLIETAAGADIEKYLSYMDCKDEGEGWYLPADNEWAYLLDTYYNVDDHTTLTIKPSEMAAERIAARDKFEAALVGLSGTKLNQLADTDSNGTTYYTSTEFSDNRANVGFACTGKPRISNGAKYANSPKRATRCIKVVDLTE